MYTIWSGVNFRNMSLEAFGEVTNFVLKEVKSKTFSEVQFWNMANILVTFSVLKFDMFNEVNLEQL